MKRLICLLMSILMLISLTACGGTFAQVDLQDTIMIPEDGIIGKEIMKTIQEEHAIGSFQGESNGLTYEWTIFGSDISEACDVNLALEIQNGEDGVSVSFAEKEPLGFPALLSIYLNESWDSLSATAYQEGKAVYSVSLTGTKNTILNLSVKDVLGDCVIRQDQMPGEMLMESDAQLGSIEESEEESEEKTQNDDSYLSVSANGDNQIYGSDTSTNITAPDKNTDDYLSVSQNSD